VQPIHGTAEEGPYAAAVRSEFRDMLDGSKDIPTVVFKQE
jgi:hypothetical protein